MRRAVVRRSAAAVAALLVGAAMPLAGAAGPAGADPIAQCTLDRGTIVAVDFGHWGGPIVRGCGVNSSTGYQLLVDADFTMAGTAHDGPAFICRIGNPAWAHGVQYPTPSTEPCSLTPPASAYWSYWLAPKGQHTWSYSQLGAMSEKPRQGEVELWHFGATNIAGTCGSGVPPYSPDVLRPGGSGNAGGDGAACSSTKDRKEASSGRQTGSSGRGTRHAGAGAAGGAGHGGGSGSGSDGGSAGGGRGAGARGASSTAASGTTRPASSAAGSTAATASRASTASSGTTGNPSVTTAGSGGPTIIDARPASADTRRPSTGSIAPVLLGVTLAVLLAGGAGWTVRRRRRTAA